MVVVRTLGEVAAYLMTSMLKRQKTNALEWKLRLLQLQLNKSVKKPQRQNGCDKRKKIIVTYPKVAMDSCMNST